MKEQELDQSKNVTACLRISCRRYMGLCGNDLDALVTRLRQLEGTV